MHEEFSGSFSDYTISICKFKIGECLITHETFLAYKFETLKNCKKLKHIMIMNIPLIYIFSSYVIFDQQLKITLISKPFSWKTLSLPPPLKKYTPPFLLTTPLKIQKVQVPPFC